MTPEPLSDRLGTVTMEQHARVIEVAADMERERAVWREKAEHCAAERDRLADTMRELWVYLRLDINHRTHKNFGEACGVDACILCLAAETAVEALRSLANDEETR